jgi:hypothetical protein
MSESLLQKPLTGLLLLAGAAGGPYLAYETEIGKQGRQAFHSATQMVTGSADSSSDSWSGLPGEFSGFETGQPWNVAAAGHRSPFGPEGIDPFRPTTASVEQMPIVSLAEILRFDITPEWVLARFPRVSTLLSEMNLDGLRVPLITGSSTSDLAGTLTYYFDRYKRLQRVSIHATVGDPTRYMNELQQAYRLSPEPSLGGNLYVIRWNGLPASILHVTPASVVYAGSTYGRYHLFLEMNQAGLQYGLSPEAQQLVDAGRSTNRW